MTQLHCEMVRIRNMPVSNRQVLQISEQKGTSLKQATGRSASEG